MNKKYINNVRIFSKISNVSQCLKKNYTLTIIFFTNALHSDSYTYFNSSMIEHILPCLVKIPLMLMRHESRFGQSDGFLRRCVNFAGSLKQLSLLLTLHLQIVKGNVLLFHLHNNSINCNLNHLITSVNLL